MKWFRAEEQEERDRAAGIQPPRSHTRPLAVIVLAVLISPLFTFWVASWMPGVPPTTPPGVSVGSYLQLPAEKGSGAFSSSYRQVMVREVRGMWVRAGTGDASEDRWINLEEVGAYMVGRAPLRFPR